MRFFAALVAFSGILAAQPIRPYNPFNQLCLPNTVVAGPSSGTVPQVPFCRALTGGDFAGAFISAVQGTAQQITASTLTGTVTISLPSNLLLPAATSVASPSTFRTNLGLGSMAVLANPLTTLGDVLYSGVAGVPTRLPGNATGARQFLISLGSGGLATAPTFGPLLIGDIPSAYPYGSLSGAPTIVYQLIGNNGASQTARNRLNLIPGTNITYSFVDNGGSGSTDLTINAATAGGLGASACASQAVGGGAVTLAFAAGVNCNKFTITTGTVAVTLPSGAGTTGTYKFIITNSGDTSNPNLSYAGASQIGLPVCVANGDETTVKMNWDGSQWVSDGAVDATAGTLAAGSVFASSSCGPPVAATATNISATEYAAGGGIAQAQTVTLSPAITALTNGLNVCWLPIANNSGAAPTLAVNGLAAKPITKLGTTALILNDIKTTAIACAQYDGTEFQLQNPQTSSGGSGTVNSGTAPQAAFYAANGTTVSGGTCTDVYQPARPDCYYILEDFSGVSTYTASRVGTYTWNSGGTGGNIAQGGSTINHPGVINITASGGTVNTQYLRLDGSGVNDQPSCPSFPSGTTLTAWKMQITFQTAAVSGANQFEVGCKDTTGFRGGNSIAIRFSDASVACTSGANSTTALMFEAFTTGSSTCVSTTVNWADSTWYTAEIAGTTGGTLTAKISTAGGAYSSPVTISSNVPSNDMYPIGFAQQDSAGLMHLYLDRFFLAIGGLAR